MLPQHSDGRGRNLFCVCKGHHRMFQIGHEASVVLGVLTFGDVDYCADDLSHATVFVAAERFVANVEPPPGAAADAAPEFEFCSLALAQNGESFYVGD